MPSDSTTNPNSPTTQWEFLAPKQMQKFMGWCVFAVLIPLAPFFYGWIATSFLGYPGSISQIAARGDLLFMAILLLAASLDWSFRSFLAVPKSQASQQTYNYLEAGVTVFVLIVLSCICGTMTTGNMPEATDAARMVFCVTTLLFVVGFCAFKLCLLLKRGYL